MAFASNENSKVPGYSLDLRELHFTHRKVFDYPLKKTSVDCEAILFVSMFGRQGYGWYKQERMEITIPQFFVTFLTVCTAFSNLTCSPALQA